jgi:hypothetical protein
VYADFEKNGVPAFFLDMLVSIDLEIPPVETVLAALDPIALLVSLDSPAFSIPATARTDELAACLVASRIAMECRNALVPPTGVSRTEVIKALQNVGIATLAIGGIAVYPAAKRLLADPTFWSAEEPSDDGMDFGRHGDDR